MQSGAQEKGLACEIERLGDDGGREVQSRVVGQSDLTFCLFGEVVK